MKSEKHGSKAPEGQTYIRTKESLNMSDAMAYQHENSLSFQSANTVNVTQPFPSHYDG